MTHKGFTLFELLVTVGILIVMATIVIVAINPVELLKQSRDTKRLVDIRTMESGIELYLSQVEDHTPGTPQTIYISIPDTDPACKNLRQYLPEPPVSWSYGCSTSANYRKVDGTGWLPIDFTQTPGGSPFETLPVDAKNSAVDLFYYAYIASSSNYALSVQPESMKILRTKTQDDHGLDPTRVEIGTDLNLWPHAIGLIGYWGFDGSSNDSTEYGRHGTLVAGPTWEPASNCKLGQCLRFNGMNGYVNIASPIAFAPSTTLAMWFNANATADAKYFFTAYRGIPGPTFPADIWTFGKQAGTNTFFGTQDTDGDVQCRYRCNNSPCPYTANQWNHAIFMSYKGSGVDNLASYLNGTLLTWYPVTDTAACNYIPNQGFTSNFTRIGTDSSAVVIYDGLFDEVRLYNRQLNDKEIELLYLATKE